MKKHILLLAILAIFILSIACNVLSYFAGDVDELDVPDYEIFEQDPDGDDGNGDDPSGGDTTGEDSVQPDQSPIPFTELHNYPPLDPLDWFFGALYPTATKDDRAKVVFTIDPNTGQLIYSIEGQEPGLYLPQVDQAGWGNAFLRYMDSWSGPPPDEVFPCDEDPNNLPPGQDWFTVCPQGVAPSTGMDWYIVYTVFEAPIPWADPDYDYTYAAVFDGDGVPDNNFQYMDPYNWDFWQNSDQWYILDYVRANDGWSVSVLGENWEMVESSARAVVYDNGLFWLINADEFQVSPPFGRVSSFATPGGWEPSDVGGDVNDYDPTEPLTPLTIEPILVNDPPMIDE